MIHYITSNGIGNAWVGTELQIVQKTGIPFVLHSMRPPHQNFFISETATRINSETRLIYPLPIVGLVISLFLAPFLFGGCFFSALCNALFSPRESMRVKISSMSHFLVACHWARSLRNEEVSHIHSQWINSCGTIGMYGAWLLGVSFSFTGHAADLFRERVALLDKIKRAEFIICISNFHREFYLKNGAREEQLAIMYCGIDTSHFNPFSRRLNEGQPFRILSSGRLVEKKGFDYLIDACKLLIDKGENIECIIGGSGPLEDELRQQTEKLGISDKITLLGEPLKQEEIPEFMHSGEVYCLPCVWASDNDVDGLPQMLMEAMACGRPAISTRLVGIPDLIIDRETGLLVEPNNAEELAEAIGLLIHDESLRDNLAKSGREYVTTTFDLRDCLKPILSRFRNKLELSTVQSHSDQESDKE